MLRLLLFRDVTGIDELAGREAKSIPVHAIATSFERKNFTSNEAVTRLGILVDEITDPYSQGVSPQPRVKSRDG